MSNCGRAAGKEERASVCCALIRPRRPRHTGRQPAGARRFGRRAGVPRQPAPAPLGPQRHSPKRPLWYSTLSFWPDSAKGAPQSLLPPPPKPPSRTRPILPLWRVAPPFCGVLPFVQFRVAYPSLPFPYFSYLFRFPYTTHSSNPDRRALLLPVVWPAYRAKMLFQYARAGLTLLLAAAAGVSAQNGEVKSIPVRCGLPRAQNALVNRS